MENKTNMFEVATRSKYRFKFAGSLTVEDLWDLKVVDSDIKVITLDTIYKALNAQAKLAEEESLLAVKTASNEELATKIEIVKHIASVKLAEQGARLQEKEKREKKQKLMGILADKQDAELLAKSPEEIQKMLAELE